ncbi:MAG: ATP-binding cassette domain-containing protein [Dokdonella sp.]
MSDHTGTALSAAEISKVVDGPDGRLTILDGIGLDVARGDSLAIVGASGSGKTTLLGLLAGLDRPSRGTITLAGQCLDTLDEEARARLRRRLVGFVFQSFHLLPALNAEENVMLPLDLEGRDDARERAAEALARVGLGQRRHHFPYQLSGGEQQRVALARAFVHGPAILFADEPTGNLDQRTGASVGDLLFALNREHATTLVLVTHDSKLAERCARSLQLREGRIVEATRASAAAGGSPASLAGVAGEAGTVGRADRRVSERRPQEPRA